MQAGFPTFPWSVGRSIASALPSALHLAPKRQDISSQPRSVLYDFTKGIQGLCQFSFSILKIIADFDGEHFKAQVKQIEELFCQSSFGTEFVQKAFHALPLSASQIPGYSVKQPCVTGFSTALLTKESVLGLGKVYQNITEFSGDASCLFDNSLYAFHSFMELTHLTLYNCKNITHIGIRYLKGIVKLKQVTLQNAPHLVRISEYPAGTKRMVLFFKQRTVDEVERLLEEHPTFSTFEANGLKKELLKPNDDEFEELISKMSNLSLLPSFAQESCRNLTDRSLRRLVTACPKLEQLLLFDCQNFTLQAVRTITQLPKLKIVSLYGCTQIPDNMEIMLFPHLKPKVSCTITKEKEL